MHFLYEVFKWQDVQPTADKIGEENNELFSNQFYWERLYFANNWTLE